MERKFEDVIPLLDGWEILSDNGWNPITKICKTIPYEEWTIRTTSFVLTCADTHILFDKNGKQVYVKDIKVGDEIVTERGLEPVLYLFNSTKKSNMYDVEVNSTSHSYNSNGIISHNTTITTIFICHYLIFNADKNVALLANKGSMAREILSRIQTAFIHLPKWMQVGVEEWNKGSIKLENGSKVIAAATSSDSVRGQSFSLVFLDECVSGDTWICVKNKDNGTEYLAQMQDFFEGTRETLLRNDNLQVLTKSGFKDFSGIKRTRGVPLHLTFDDGKSLTCSPGHKLVNSDGSFVQAQDLNNGDIVDGRTLTSKIFTHKEVYLYDLLSVEGNHTYITNGINSSNCAFIPKNVWTKFFSSTWPTISSGKESKFILVSTPQGENHFYDFWKGAIEGKNGFHPSEVNWWDVPGRDEKWREEQLQAMSEEQFNIEYGNSFVASSGSLISPEYFKRLEINLATPIQSVKNTRIFNLPERGRQYIATADCADGGGDFSTISIIDISEFPYKQVAVYADNTISHLSFPNIIHQLCEKYNNADVLVESNDIGKTILHILNYDIDYDNIIHTFKKTGGSELGQRTTKRTKALGCSRLKDMVESKGIIIQDADTLAELRHFKLKGASYEAEIGYHDDLVMGLVNFAHYASTPEFRMRFDSNFTDEYRERYENEVMEQLTPLPLFGATLDETSEKDLRWLS